MSRNFTTRSWEPEHAKGGSRAAGPKRHRWHPLHAAPSTPPTPASLPLHPVPLQYTPSLGMAVLKRVGPARAQALKEGRSGYDTAALIKSASETSLRG